MKCLFEKKIGKILSAVFLVLAVSFLSLPSISQAVDTPSTGTSNSPSVPLYLDLAKLGATTFLGPVGFPIAGAAQVAKLAASGVGTSPNGCGAISVGCHIVTAIGQTILTVAGFFMWIAALVFDYIINFTVVNFQTNLKAIPAVDIGWATFRDLANIFFIFILLYIAIATILRLETINTKKTLTTLIVIALLLNFSLFFTKVIIDGSNIFSLVFLSKIQIKGQPLNLDPAKEAGSTGPLTSTLANAFAAPLGLGSLFGVGGVGNGAPTGDTFGITDVDHDYPKLFLIEFFSSILLLILAFVFFAAAILFTARFVVLVFLMLLSPLAFAGMILPKTKSMIADKWWKALIDQTLFAPVFFMLLWVVLQIISSDSFIKAGGGKDPKFSDLFGTNGFRNGAGLLMNYFLVMALLVGTIIVSKVLGAHGAAGALSVGNDIRKGAQGYLGRGAVRATGLNRAENFLAGTRIGESAPMRALRSVTTGAASKAKFGSKDSAQTVDKADKKRAEDIAKKTDEKISGTFKDKLPGRREERASKIGSEITAHSSEMTAAQKEQADAEANFKTVDRSNQFSPAGNAKRAEAQKAVDAAKEKVRLATVKEKSLNDEKTHLAEAQKMMKETGMVKEMSEQEKADLNKERMAEIMYSNRKSTGGKIMAVAEKARDVAAGAAIGAMIGGPLGAIAGGVAGGFKRSKKVFVGSPTSDVDKAVAKRMEQRLAGKNIELEETLKEIAAKEKADSGASKPAPTPKPPTPPTTP